MVVEFFRARGIYYGWVILAVCFVTTFLVMGFRFAFGVFYVAILDDTGWQRGETAAIFSVAMGTYAVMCLASGAIFDWVGPRVLFPLGAVVLGIGLVLCSTLDSLWEFYLYYGVLVGTAYALIGFIPHMAYVPRWFARRRGLGTSIALSGVGVGSLFISVVSERLLEVWDWRTLFLGFGIVVMVVLIPLTAIFHRNSPESIGLFPDGDPEPPVQSAREKKEGELGMMAGMATSRFWLLFTSVTMIGAGSMTMVVHQTRLLVDMGYSLTVAAGFFGFTGLLRSFGGMFWGPLSDRFGRRFCAGLVSAAGVLAIALLLLGQTRPQIGYLIGFILLWGLGYTSGAPVYASAVADLFPGPHLGKRMGLLDQGFGIGSALGPFVAGVIFDRQGSYVPMLWLLIGAATVQGICLWLAASQIPAIRQRQRAA